MTGLARRALTNHDERSGDGVFLHVERDPRRSGSDAVLALVGFVGLCLLVWVADVMAARGRLGWAVLLAGLSVCVSAATAAWLVWREAGVARRLHYRALRLWGWQLLAVASWVPVCMTLRAPGLGFLVLAAAAGLVGSALMRFWRISRPAGLLMVPVLVWVGGAAAVDLSLW